MTRIPDEILQELADKLARLKPRDAERRRLIERTAHLFACSPKTVYRQVAKFHGPKRCTRSDQGRPRLSFAKTLSGLYFQSFPQAARRS